MFGKKKSVAVATLEAPQFIGGSGIWGMPEPAPEPPPPPKPAAPTRPEPIAVEVVDSDALAEYVAVAESIGFSNPALARARLLNFLQREEIPVYDNGRVDEFMGNIVSGINSSRPRGERDLVWIWKPLIGEARRDFWTVNGAFHWRQYSMAVPMGALKDVAKVKAEFPEARFYVTDYETVKPDPFLCVKLDGCEHVVIAVWDEPDFKLTKKA